MDKTDASNDELVCVVCGKPARVGQPTMVCPEKDLVLHGRCYDAELDPGRNGTQRSSIASVA
jgi:hypothetical protein